MIRTRPDRRRQVTDDANWRMSAGYRYQVSPLPAIPVSFAAILVQIAIFAVQFALLMIGSPVVAVTQIAAQFPAVVRNFCLIVADVALVAPVAILGKQCAGAQCKQQ